MARPAAPLGVIRLGGAGGIDVVIGVVGGESSSLTANVYRRAK
jgi:hypothetical protein